MALMIGCLIAIYGLMPERKTKEVLDIMNEGIKDTGLIMLITGVGGSLGYVVRASGIGSVLGKMVVGLPIPAVLIPFCIAALMRIVLALHGCHRHGGFADHAAYGPADHQRCLWP